MDGTKKRAHDVLRKAANGAIVFVCPLAAAPQRYHGHHAPPRVKRIQQYPTGLQFQIKAMQTIQIRIGPYLRF